MEKISFIALMIILLGFYPCLGSADAWQDIIDWNKGFENYDPLALDYDVMKDPYNVNKDPNYVCALDPNNPYYSERNDPNSPKYDPWYNPFYDPLNILYWEEIDPYSDKYDPMIDPFNFGKDPDYEPLLDPIHPVYDPRLDPLSDQYDPSYNPYLDVVGQATTPPSPVTPPKKDIPPATVLGYKGDGKAIYVLSDNKTVVDYCPTGYRCAPDIAPSSSGEGYLFSQPKQAGTFTFSFGTQTSIPGVSWAPHSAQTGSTGVSTPDACKTCQCDKGVIKTKLQEFLNKHPGMGGPSGRVFGSPDTADPFENLCEYQCCPLVCEEIWNSLFGDVEIDTSGIVSGLANPPLGYQ